MSSGVSSTVILHVAAPAALTVSEMAAVKTLSGTSAMMSRIGIVSTHQKNAQAPAATTNQSN